MARHLGICPGQRARQIALYQCCTEVALAPTGGVDEQQRVWLMKLPLIS